MRYLDLRLAKDLSEARLEQAEKYNRKRSKQARSVRYAQRPGQAAVDREKRQAGADAKAA